MCKFGEMLMRQSSRFPVVQLQRFAHIFEAAYGSCRRLTLKCRFAFLLDEWHNVSPFRRSRKELGAP